MKETLKIYINKLVTYVPVAVFFFTVLFFINIDAAVSDLKTEFGNTAIDELVAIYRFYFIRTIILTLFIPLYDVVLSNQKFSYKTALFTHFLCVLITVGVVFYDPSAPIEALYITLILCGVIYSIIRIVIYLRERHFISEANRILLSNIEK